MTQSDAESGGPRLWRAALAFGRSTPRRSFVLYPLLVGGFESLRQRRVPRVRLAYVPLLVWGYFQYRLVGSYRQRLRAGSVGMERLPETLIQGGPYALTRNPMYLGHLIFLTGLALTFRSPLAWLILLGNVPWFHARVLEDEARLRNAFGAEYERYCGSVRRWIPGLF
jgi:protein-S-isoprenylcysteine O-methyltransferase Ste14